MNPNIKIYYIPKNPNIIKGHIYTLYINNNTNLDLQPILNAKNLNIKSQTPISQTTSSFMISEKDYTRLLELNNQAYQLTNKRTTSIQNFLQEENRTITELAKINTERQELIKKLTARKEHQV